MFLSQYKLKTFIVDGTLWYNHFDTWGVWILHLWFVFIEKSVIATLEWYSTQKQQIDNLVFI